MNNFSVCHFGFYLQKKIVYDFLHDLYIYSKWVLIWTKNWILCFDISTHSLWRNVYITFARSLHLSHLLVIFTKRLFWQEDTLSLIRLGTYQHERNTYSKKGKCYFTDRHMIWMKEECFILGREFFVLFIWRNCSPTTLRKVKFLAPSSNMCCSKSATLGLTCFDLILFQEAGKVVCQIEYGLMWDSNEVKPLIQFSL